MKAQRKQAIQYEQYNKKQQAEMEAKRLKEQSAQHLEIIAMQKEQDYVKNSTIKQAIRQ